MDTNCAPLVVDLFLLCYERDFTMSLFDDNQAYIIEAFVAGTSYSVSRILSQAHAYAIYYDTKYLSIIFTIFIY